MIEMIVDAGSRFFMDTPHAEKLDDFLRRLPRPSEIKDRLAQNLHEGRLLRQLLKLAEQQEQVRGGELCER
jgi:hypothetical protein